MQSYRVQRCMLAAKYIEGKIQLKKADFYLRMSKIDAGSLSAGRSINTRIPTNDAHALTCLHARVP